VIQRRDAIARAQPEVDYETPQVFINLFHPFGVYVDFPASIIATSLRD